MARYAEFQEFGRGVLHEQHAHAIPARYFEELPAIDFQAGDFISEQLFAGFIPKSDFVSGHESAGCNLADNNGAICARASATTRGNFMHSRDFKPCELTLKLANCQAGINAVAAASQVFFYRQTKKLVL